ncbi:uncharacterized protein PGTG_22525 [Puccinia graminis f. sp. tritici CRL 75-36-700-3]|uniref:EF-hand domain-containing protein n=1 Tax=Puccinia graminis f. sp. tritici (strain CRL 75-36-700-3 / race SCCL) TaxID=418459 RepID=H6QUT8_PUCGT|nr:uncharacterized protein PGTG_22525 [Puccinia graminis f. sp. tritici CRL 75-36-700-3]EHS64846.1 hypothetical protein PGTG_22525 [Puccinia graminis f. sp. tritici CRL 75-36-700-3]
MTSNPASVATQYKAIVDKLGDMGVYLAYNDLLLLVLHDAIPQGSNLRQEFDQRIDTEFDLNGRQVITFEKTWRILSEAISGAPQQTRRICFCCRSPNHLISQFTAPDPSSRPATQQPLAQAQSGHVPPGFQAYYPIISPTGAVPMYYPPRLNQHNPNSSPVWRGRMDSYRPQYGQQSNRPAARAAEPAAVPPVDLSFNNLDVSANPAGDSNPQ